MAVSIITPSGEQQRLTFSISRWWTDNLADGFTGQHGLFAKLNAKKRVVTGGFVDSVVVAIMFPDSNQPRAVGVADPYVKQSHKPMRGMGRMKFNVAEYQQLISAPKRELRANRAPARMVNYMDKVMLMARKLFVDTIVQDMWAPEHLPESVGVEWQIASLRTLINKGGPSTSSGGNRPNPISAQYSAASDSTGSYTWSAAVDGPAAAEAAQTPQFVVGGINRNAAGNIFACVPVLNPSSPATLSETLINRLILLATRGSDRPDLAIWTMSDYATILGMVQAKQQIQPSRLTDYGFQAFSWMGVDFIYDDDVPTAAPGKNAFVLNTNQLTFGVDSSDPDVTEGVDTERPLREWHALAYCFLINELPGRGLGARHANIA